MRSVKHLAMSIALFQCLVFGSNQWHAKWTFGSSRGLCQGGPLSLLLFCYSDEYFWQIGREGNGIEVSFFWDSQ